MVFGATTDSERKAFRSVNPGNCQEVLRTQTTCKCLCTEQSRQPGRRRGVGGCHNLSIRFVQICRLLATRELSCIYAHLLICSSCSLHCRPYTSTHIHTHIHASTHTHKQAHAHSTRAHTHVNPCTYTHRHVHTQMQGYMHKHASTHTDARSHAHTNTHTHAST